MKSVDIMALLRASAVKKDLGFKKELQDGFGRLKDVACDVFDVLMIWGYNRCDNREIRRFDHEQSGIEAEMAGTVISFAGRVSGMDTVSRYPMTFFLEAVQADDLFSETSNT